MQALNKTVIRTLYIFTAVALCGSLLIVISALTNFRHVELTAVAGAIGCICCLLFFWLLSREQYTIPRILIPLALYGLGTFLIINVSVHDESLLLFPLAISLAGLFIGKRGILIFSVLIVLTTTFVVVTQFSKDTNLATILVLFFLIGLSGIILYVLVNMLQENYEKIRLDQKLLTEANRELELGHSFLEKQVLERTQAAEAARAEAEAARSAAEAARSGLEAQVWLTTGQTLLADAMRGEQDIQELARNVIRQICVYLNAQAGSLYLLDNKTLTLTGVYAFTESPGQASSLSLGEGLAGQAAEDGKMLNSGNIPPDTRLVTTGLASFIPRQVIAFPFHANGMVMGVIELALLSAVSKAQQELLERSSENIGIAFLTGRTRRRLEDLLVETQQQAEELQAQEEELRAANEELQVQATALKTRRVRSNRKDVE